MMPLERECPGTRTHVNSTGLIPEDIEKSQTLAHSLQLQVSAPRRIVDVDPDWGKGVVGPNQGSRRYAGHPEG